MDQLTLSCPNCTQPVGESDRYCEVCGIDLSAARAASADPRSAAPSPTPATPDEDDDLADDYHFALDAFGTPAGPSSSPAGGPAGASPAGGVIGADFGTGPAGAAGGAGMAGAGPAGSTHGSAPGVGQAAAGAAGAQGAAGAGSGATGDFVLAAPLLATEVEGPEAAAVSVPDPWSSVAVGDSRLCVGCGAQRIDTDGYCEACGLAQPRPRDHQERSLNGVCGVSDRGHRHHRNEDAFAVAATSRPDGNSAAVAVVCDGVSSATRPDDASQAAADTASETLLEALESGEVPETAMTQAIMSAAARVDALATEYEREPSRNAPACTIVSAVVTEGRVTIGWVGDSRAYWFPDDRSGSRRLTVDDSWATRMVEAGLMTEAEAFADPRAHAITGWLGADAIEVEPHITTFVPDAPGTVLICSDGLWNYAEAAADLAAVVPADARTKPLQAAQTLARYACDRGGHDNVTVALLPVDRVDPPEPTMPDHPPTLVGESLDSPTIQLREGES
ncbi:serine/threonine-protein phosphatase [Streptacidiphilus pinicola]|uniref:Serine/threonine-protein phosphatase n=2 Tax=Streptacidiphilus pinicola TaxID=2219663 RepID=A0A2X0K5D0_9ACTN|nr:PP2C family protein-serine/threonine phosphatase [Streptacidiphilus pinicola]RAG82779.1 serine/threonine-protein phosphatase [Streptacidiphilus pinicola]